MLYVYWTENTNDVIGIFVQRDPHNSNVTTIRVILNT